MSSIEEKIRAFGQKRDVEGLQNYINELSTEELLNVIQTKLSTANFPFTWNYVLQGFTDSAKSHNTRFKIVMKVLEELENNDISSSQSNTIIHRLCIELVKFKTTHLVKLCDFCMECLQSQRITQMSWKELLPELLNVIVERECVERNDTEMTGLEYKHQMINSMCMLHWSPSIVTPLSSMFIDMPLTKEEHFQIVNKLAQYLEKMTIQEVPPFVYQLLRLCKNSNGRLVFLKLQHYFGVRVYENLANQSEPNSEQTTDFDAIENTNDQDVIEAESTILFHIHSSASLGHECIKDYLSSLKNMIKSPEFILHPFQLSALLTISTISHYEERIFDLIRSCVTRTYHEEQKKAASAWFREMVPSTYKIESVFAQIINLSAQDRDLVLQGLVNFAFQLLGVGSALGRDVIAEKQWQLGNMILFKIIKRKRHIAPVIIQQLSDRIIFGHSVTQYIECMYLLSKNLTLLMLENKSSVVYLMEGLVQMPGNNAKLLLDAIIPLIKVSPTIRDHFILLLRKALYSRVTETRQMAVIGFLKLLTNLKISNLAVVSQNSFSSGSFSSGHSLYTQISINRSTQSAPSAFSNEALCLEILSILRRCFMQQPEVKIQLYEGLYNAVCLNPELGVPVLEMIWLHFSDFYNIDDETLPPLQFQKIFSVKDVTVTLQEPLGKLIYTVGLIATKVAKTDNENETVIKFIDILESLCTRMTKCELIHFELDDGTDLLDIIPESQQKLLILKEAMCVYEALIGYKFYSWELSSEDQGKQINYLFQGYSRLLHFSKDIHKPKKADSKKKKGGNDATTQSNTTIKKDQKSSKSFKMPDTVLDFQVMGKIISILHEPTVSWTTIGQASVVRSKTEIHQHMMQATLCLVTSLKHQKILDVQQAKIVYGNLCEISTILYERVVKRLTDFIDFDCTTAMLTLECFLVVLNVISIQFKGNFESFIRKVGDKEEEEGFVAHLTEFIETYQKSFETDEEKSDEDPDIKKMSVIVINTLNFLSHHIPSSTSALASQMMEWLKNYATNNIIGSKQAVTSFVNLLFDFHIKSKVSLTFFEQVSSYIGHVTGVIKEEEDKVEEIKMITEHTVNNVLISFTNSLKSMLEDIDWIIARLRAEFSMITYPGEDSSERKRDQLKSKERGVTCQLCFIVKILTNLSNCTVPTGNLSEAILKNLTLLYCTLSSLTKYFIMRSSRINLAFQAARFEKLVKLAGKQLAPVVYRLITYIEESQKQESDLSQSKKKNVDSSTLKSKVLKETRLIPKVVYEIEQFSKFVIQLSNKTKVDLSKFVGQGTARDFRITHLKKVLQQANDGAPVSQSSQEDETSLIESDGNEESDEASPPPTKKSKC